MRQGCTNKGVVKSYFLFLILLSTLFLIATSSLVTSASLATSVSIVESGSFLPGDTFHCIVEIRNSQASGRQDVYLYYEILDENEEHILLESTTVAIETLSSFSKELKLPDFAQDGIYTLKAKVETLDRTQSCEASTSFRVIARVIDEGEQKFVEYFMGIALIITVVALLYEHRRISKMKVSSNDLKKYLSDHKER